MTNCILGLNAFHGDSSACLVVDGRLVAAAEEERFRRIKHWAGFPSKSIHWCLEDAGVKLGDVSHVAINQDPRAHLLRKAVYALAHQPDLGLILDRIRNKRRRTGALSLLSQMFPGQQIKAKFWPIEHHLAHLSSAFHVSPYDRAVAVSVDGFGDFASAGWGLGEGSRVSVDGRVFFPHSLGVFYQALTQYLGFPHYGDEYKLMGLAPYGEPIYMDAMRRIVQVQSDGGFRLNLKFFRHHCEKIAYQWQDGAPVFGPLYSAGLEQLLGPPRDPQAALEQRHKDLARSVQAMYEEAFFNLLRVLHARYRTEAVVVAGGCGMNSVANGKIALRTPFKSVYVQSAAGDAGGAIGAAYAVWHRQGGERCFVMNHAYWGPSYGTDEVQALLMSQANAIEKAGCRTERIADEATLCRRAAESIAVGKVVGWFQGRMEWGPRALGNRSIVCDPRRSDMKDILNQKIKRRESFRPFAPSILREAVPDWFETDGDVPFMMQVFQIREEKRAQIPAVTHVDGSGRLQTVTRDANPLYYRLIENFRDQTGVPMVLNTSFNENEPVVCRPEEALDCFLRTRMDVLVLGNHFIQRD